MVIAFVFEKLRYTAFRIQKIAKYNCISGAGLGTGRFNFPFGNWSAFKFCQLFFLLNTLDAHGAFFDHTPRPNCHIRVQYHSAQIAVGSEVKFLVLHILEPVESSNTIWTIIHAIFCSDATVISYLIQSFLAVRSCLHRAYIFAGGIATMLAHHRLERYLRVLRVFRIIPVNPYPMHDTAVTNLFLPDYLNVIFSLTSYG